MKITARPFSETDVATRVAWINDERIHLSMFFDLPATVANTLKWYESNIGNRSRADLTFAGENGQIVAMGGFTGIDAIHSNAEFYVMVNPDLHGKGFGKSISKWLFNYAFLNYHLNKIYLYTNDDNVMAYKIYEDCSFKLEGVLRKHKFKNAEFQNRRFYGLLREEWQQLDWAETTINYEF